MTILSYGKQNAFPALAGQLDAATRDADVDSMVCSATGPIPFGRMLERDGLPRSVKVFDGTGTVYGISIRDDVREQSYGTPGAQYVAKDIVPVIRKGRVWMYTGNSGSAFLTIGAAVVGIPSSEVIDVASDPNGDKLALVDVNIPVA